MKKIINDCFHVGETYIGEIDGSVLDVVRIADAFDGSGKRITFKDRKTGRISQTTVEWAKRLLLRKAV